ncbi:MAG TPA: BglG family transcription antiterminator [Candidatus Anaerostipes excrementavium]|uniref:BglG family transcription antiterminator n=1 Tax=Candidatus Anaerostipes excrementavium TaxID=2838463 RepID=A0A9D1WVQ6_9FIRM|nr:BglG family transcription antiterminator [uncultured Anaerostipes sp.]HIX67777.1 BglG family transcription antiterminator [Candidatus Anaerostipes excrementavium]
MRRSKDKFYMKQIFDCIMDGEVYATGKIAQEIGLSEKSVRNKLNEMNEFLEHHNLGEIQRKPRVGIWLEASASQKEQIQALLNNREHFQFSSYDPRERMTETLKIFFNMRPWQTITTQKLSEQLYLSVPTMLKVLKECEEWLSVYHITLVNERGKGYRLKSKENEYRVALKNLIMEKGSTEEMKEKIHYFFSNMDVPAVTKCIIQTENEWNYRFTDESFYEILIYCCLAYKRKELAIPMVSDYNPEELKILKKYSEYAFTVAIFEKLEEVFHVHFLSEDILFLSIQILCSKFIGISDVEITLGQVKKYDNKLVEFVDRMLKVISDILEVNLSDDQKLKESLIVHLRPTIFRLRYGTPQNNALIDFIKEEYKNVFRASWAISILFEESYNLQITEDEIGYIVLYIQAAIERKKHQYKALMITNSNMGHVQLMKERIKKAVPEIGELKFVSTHEFRLADHDDCDIIISQTPLKERDKRSVVIPNILSENGLMVLRSHLDVINSQRAENQTPFSPECCLLFSPEFIFTDLKAKTKEECLRIMCAAMEEKGIVTKDFFDTVMERESKTTTTIGNGISIPHGSPTEVNEPKVAIALLREPIMWDDEPVRMVFLLGFRMSTREEINRIQLFYNEYVSLIDTEEKIRTLQNMKSNIEVYKYLIQ